MLLFIVKLLYLHKVKTVKPRNLLIMKRIYLSLMLLLGVTTASAQSYDYLILKENNGNVTGLKIDGLKLTFNEGNIVAQNAEGTKTIALADMQKMYFGGDPTSVGTVTNGDVKDLVTVENGSLKVNAPADAKVAVYSIDGRQVKQGKLTKGTYVVRVNNKSVKVLVK